MNGNNLLGLHNQSMGAELFLFLLDTVIITALLSAFSLWRYRQSVLAGMHARAGSLLAIPVPNEAPTRASAVDVTSAALAWERVAHRRVVCTYLLSVGAGALVLAVLELVQSGTQPTAPRIVAEAGVMAICAVPMIAVSLAWPWWHGARFALAALCAVAIATGILAIAPRMVSGRLPGPDQLLNFVRPFAFAGVRLSVPLLLLLASGTSKLRGIAPTTFAALILFGLAPFAASRLNLSLGETAMGSAYLLATSRRLGLHATFLMLALPVGWIAWNRLHAVARAYGAKRFSDAQLLSRTWWLMFVAETGFTLINAGSGPALTLGGCIAAYAAFPLTSRWLFRRVGLGAGRERPRTLLLLRVFGYVARTEKLFDRLGSRWRYFGPVSVIAAPDVVARTVSPGDFLGWLTGKTDEDFVRSQADLERKLANFDAAVDPDGRYRVNQFSCRDDTWRATVVALIDRADAIVMDLRGLTATRGGCKFELEQLAQRAHPSRVVLLVDKDTEQDMLSDALGDARARVVTTSLVRGNAVETDALFAALLKAAG